MPWADEGSITKRQRETWDSKMILCLDLVRVPGCVTYTVSPCKVHGTEKKGVKAEINGQFIMEGSAAPEAPHQSCA